MLDDVVPYLCLFSPLSLYLLRHPALWVQETPLLCEAYLCHDLQRGAQRLAQVYPNQGQSKIILLVRQAGHSAGPRRPEGSGCCCNVIRLKSTLADPQMVIKKNKMDGVAVGCSTSVYLENRTWGGFFSTDLPLKLEDTFTLGKKCTTEIAMKITHVNDHLHQLTSPVASSNVKHYYISVSVSCQHIFY